MKTMKKAIIGLPLVILLLSLIFGWFAINQYFYYVGPELAKKEAYAAELKKLEVDKEKLLLLDRAIEEQQRLQTTTNFYLWFSAILLISSGGTVLILIWKTYDKRKESWARPVDGMFALQTYKANGVTWTVDPNKTFTSAIGVADSGEIAELPVSNKVGADRQLDYNKSVQTTRSAIAVSQGEGGFKYAAVGKFLSGAYNRTLSTKNNGETYEEVPTEPLPLISLTQAWEESTDNKWILGQSELNGKKCTVDLLKVVHLAIIGAPGVGKTASTGLLLAANAVQAGMIVLCLDGKGGYDWLKYQKYFEVQETDATVFPMQFGAIAKEHNRRRAILKENNWKTIDESKGEIKHVLVVLEEFGALLQNIQMIDKVLHQRIVIAVTNLMKVSRSTGIHFCIIDQTLADCPGEIKGIMKFYIAYKLNASQGNSVKMYYLDKLADHGEFCCSDDPDNKFKAWHTEVEFKTLPIEEREWHLLPDLPELELKGVPTEFESKKLLSDESEVEHVIDLSDANIIEIYKREGSLNKTTQAIFGDGKKGKYYADQIKPALIKEGLING